MRARHGAIGCVAPWGQHHPHFLYMLLTPRPASLACHIFIPSLNYPNALAPSSTLNLPWPNPVQPPKHLNQTLPTIPLTAPTPPPIPPGISMVVMGHPVLEDLDGFSRILTVPGDMVIYETSISDLGAMAGLQAVGLSCVVSACCCVPAGKQN